MACGRSNSPSPPRFDEVAINIEDYERPVAAIEDVDAVLRVDSHRRCFLESHRVRQFRPSMEQVRMACVRSLPFSRDFPSMRWVMRCSVVMLHGNRGVLGATLCAAVASRVRLICDMRAIRLHGYNDIRFEDIPVPEPADGDALIEVSRTSICATDIEVWQSPLRFGGDDDGPLVMGHEIGGTVVDVRGDADIAPGTRVVVNNVLTCRECFWCIRGSQATCPKMRVAGLSADGGLAEYLVWPSTHVVPLSDEVDDDVAPLLEPTTVAVHAARRSGIKPGRQGCGAWMRHCWNAHGAGRSGGRGVCHSG